MKVLLIGPIARPGVAAPGGYESANRRTIDSLRSRGVEVQELPYKKYEAKYGKVLSYALAVISTIQGLVKSRNSRSTIAHITALQKHFLYYEFFIFICCKLLRLKYVFDLRAGSAIVHYKTRGKVYKTIFVHLVKKSDMVLVEGKEYFQFIRSLGGHEPKYFPNFVNFVFDLNNRGQRNSQNRIKLCYLGRVVREKGVSKIIEVLGVLKDSGVQVELYIVGHGKGSYLSELRAMAKIMDCESLIKFHGELAPSQISDFLSEMHFFIFPSFHQGEGHSNALTEAMSCGVVPICSNNGFNKSVVERAGRILPMEATPEDYAREILNIYQSDEWKTLSAICAKRARDHYSAEVVLDNLMIYYKQVLSS